MFANIDNNLSVDRAYPYSGTMPPRNRTAKAKMRGTGFGRYRNWKIRLWRFWKTDAAL